MLPALASPATVQLSPAERIAFVAECNRWTDAHNPPMTDAELDALERRASLADALADAELSLQSQAAEVSL